MLSPCAINLIFCFLQNEPQNVEQGMLNSEIMSCGSIFDIFLNAAEPMFFPEHESAVHAQEFFCSSEFMVFVSHFPSISMSSCGFTGLDR